MNGEGFPISISEISLARHTHRGRARIWHQQIQPEIDKDPQRPDAGWNWPYVIAPFTLFGGWRRTCRIFQISLRDDNLPAAMIAILQNERWFDDEHEQAVFLWYLSTAPASMLTKIDSFGAAHYPTMIGTAALDIALCVALDECEGRLWLHAASGGGDKLLNWYAQKGMRNIDRRQHATLPGFGKGRKNDGRYFFFYEKLALEAYGALNKYREPL